MQRSHIVVLIPPVSTTNIGEVCSSGPIKSAPLPAAYVIQAPVAEPPEARDKIISRMLRKPICKRVWGGAPAEIEFGALP